LRAVAAWSQRSLAHSKSERANIAPTIIVSELVVKERPDPDRKNAPGKKAVTAQEVGRELRLVGRHFPNRGAIATRFRMLCRVEVGSRLWEEQRKVHSQRRGAVTSAPAREFSISLKDERKISASLDGGAATRRPTGPTTLSDLPKPINWLHHAGKSASPPPRRGHFQAGHFAKTLS
jgi:hypothetical protein